MYQGKNKGFYAVMLLVSMAFRICMLFGVDEKLTSAAVSLAQNQKFTKTMLLLETGQAADVEEPEPQAEPVVVYMMDPVPRPKTLQTAPLPKPEQETPELESEPQPEPPLLPVCLASAEELKIVGGCTYSYDAEALLHRPTAMDVSGEGPAILIVHTHTTEAYEPEPGWEYEPTAPYRTLDETRSVVAVGDRVTQKLREAGFTVYHDTTLHDYPEYNPSYWNCLETIENQLEAHPDIQMVIDLHRDAAEDKNGNAVALCSQQGASQVAQLMLVVGTCQGGLDHPNWQENLANALKLQSVLDGMYPGLCRKLDLRTERFNQHATPGSILIEVGSNGNTLQQALDTADLLSDSLIRMLDAMKLYGGTLENQEVS